MGVGVDGGCIRLLWDYGITGLRDYSMSADQTGSFERIKARKGTHAREERRGSAVQGNDRMTRGNRRLKAKEKEK